MCSRMEEGLLFSELRKGKHPSLCPFRQDSSLLHKGPCSAIRNTILIRFYFCCGPVPFAVAHDWPTFIHQHNFVYLLENESGYVVCYLFLIFVGKEVTFLETQNERWKQIAVCMLPCRQDRREILVGSMDWQAVSVILFHSVIKSGDNARVVKLDWHFALSHWVQQLSCI